MAPDSQAVVLIAIALAILFPVLLAVLWSRVNRWWRPGLIVLCLGSAVAAGGLWTNSQVEAYTTWARVFGAKAEAAAAKHPSDEDFNPVSKTLPGGGRVLTETVAGVNSKITMPMYVYLRPGYSSHPAMRYPVIEAFHGAPGGPLFWITKLNAPSILDREIKSGRMAPAVVLFPYQTPDPALDTECTNIVGGPQAETYLTQDVPAFAAAHLHVRSDPGSWGLIGFSAGAYCASDLLLRHPAQYRAGAGLSGNPNPGIAVGDGSEHTTYNGLWRLSHLPQPAVALYLACGKGDKYAFRGAQTTAQLAHAPLSVTTAYVEGGGHNTKTWRDMEAPAFDWLSTWLGQPFTTTRGVQRVRTTP